MLSPWNDGTKGGRRNPERHAAYMRHWREKNRERAREIGRTGSAEYRAADPDRTRSQQAKYREKLRAHILAFFGGKCVRCGFADSRALQMDHVHGGGHRWRKEHGEVLYDRYRFVVDYPDVAREAFQLLCANCNCIKRVENHEYANGSGRLRLITNG